MAALGNRIRSRIIKIIGFGLFVSQGNILLDFRHQVAENVSRHVLVGTMLKQCIVSGTYTCGISERRLSSQLGLQYFSRVDSGVVTKPGFEC